MRVSPLFNAWRASRTLLDHDPRSPAPQPTVSVLLDGIASHRTYDQGKLMKSVVLWCCVPLIVASLSIPAHAIIGLTSESFADITPGLVAPDDLANSGSADLSSISSTPFGSIPSVNDGTASFSSIQEEFSQYPATIDFNFNTVDNPLGYSISDVSIVTGLTQSEAQVFLNFAPGGGELSPQLYTLSYSLVDDPSFTELITVSDLGPAAIRKVSLVGLTSEITGGVDVLRFTWSDPYPSVLTGVRPSDETVTILREIDIFGSAIRDQIPEPSASVLALCGGVLAAKRRRRS